MWVYLWWGFGLFCCGDFVFSSLFLPSFQAQTGSLEYLFMENFMCRMKEFEWVADKLS